MFAVPGRCDLRIIIEGDDIASFPLGDLGKLAIFCASALQEWFHRNSPLPDLFLLARLDNAFSMPTI